MSLIDQLSGIARAVVEVSGAYLVDIAVRGTAGEKAVEIFVDTDAGITTGQCAGISRELSQALDAAEIIRGSYHLVVSSPGLDRPLKYPRQYRKNVGRKLAVSFRRDARLLSVEGELLEVTEDRITLRTGRPAEEKGLSLKFDEIVEARVLPAW